MSNVLGYNWLIEHYDLQIVQPLRLTSEIGSSRQTRITDGFVRELYPPPTGPSLPLPGT